MPMKSSCTKLHGFNALLTREVAVSVQLTYGIFQLMASVASLVSGEDLLTIRSNTTADQTLLINVIQSILWGQRNLKYH